MSKKAKLRLAVYIVTSFLLSLAVLLLITVINLFLLFYTPDKIRGNFTVKVDDTNENIKPYLVQSVDAKSLYRQGSWYVNFNDIADVYGFSVSGDRLHLRYVLRNDADDIMTVDFENGSICLNDVPILSGAPIMDSQGQVYLPVDVINTYFEGIEISRDLDQKIILIVCEDQCFVNVRIPETTPKIDKAQMP